MKRRLQALWIGSLVVLVAIATMAGFLAGSKNKNAELVRMVAKNKQSTDAQASTLDAGPAGC